jgi:hypothetical protein
VYERSAAAPRGLLIALAAVAGFGLAVVGLWPRGAPEGPVAAPPAPPSQSRPPTVRPPSSSEIPAARPPDPPKTSRALSRPPPVRDGPVERRVTVALLDRSAELAACLAPSADGPDPPPRVDVVFDVDWEEDPSVTRPTRIRLVPEPMPPAAACLREIVGSLELGPDDVTTGQAFVVLAEPR